MAETSQNELYGNENMKPWQYCSLFNIDLSNGEEHNLHTSNDAVNKTKKLEKLHLNHSCPFVVLQRNYTTQLEHVAENLLTNKYDECCYCSASDTNDTRIQLFNKKILFNSTAILDNFLKNNLKTSLLTSSNISSTLTSIKITGNQRRWHSERSTRNPNNCANLPLTSTQRQLLEQYMNDPLVQTKSNIRSKHRSRHKPITGKILENTGTALFSLDEPLLKSSKSISKINLRNNSISTSQVPVNSTLQNSSSISVLSHHNSINQHYFLIDNNENQKNNQSHSILTNVSSQCIICCERKPLQKRSCCNFYLCSTCLSIYVEQQVKQGIIQIQCPNQNCSIYMNRDEINQFCLSSDLEKQLKQIIIENNRTINKKTCPRCSSLHEIDIQFFQSLKFLPTKVQCFECNLIWCFQCHSPWHDGIQCKEFRRGDRMLKKWAKEVHYGQQNAQKCPSCKIYIQRTEGCDHIVCLHCKTEFCYKCGDRFRDIKFIGDHYSELSVLGCKHRFYPDDPFKRQLIRGSILGGKILVAPILLSLSIVTGVLFIGIGLPVYCCFRAVKKIKMRRQRYQPSKLNEPLLINYKKLNDMVPQLIPREPVNINGVKAGFNSMGMNVQNNLDIDQTSDAPLAVFDERDDRILTNGNDLSNSLPSHSSSSNFPRLIFQSKLRKFISKQNK